MSDDFQFEFFKRRYESLDELLELEKLIDQNQKASKKDLTKEQVLTEIMVQFAMIDAFYCNLLKMSFEERAEFILRHGKVDATRISYTFDLDEEVAKKIFHYLQLSDIGRCTEDCIEIEDAEKFKKILVNKLYKEI